MAGYVNPTKKVKKKACFRVKTGFSHFLLVEISGIEPLTS